jgi:hypothetical protein
LVQLIYIEIRTTGTSSGINNNGIDVLSAVLYVAVVLNYELCLFVRVFLVPSNCLRSSFCRAIHCPNTCGPNHRVISFFPRRLDKKQVRVYRAWKTGELGRDDISWGKRYGVEENIWAEEGRGNEEWRRLHI